MCNYTKAKYRASTKFWVAPQTLTLLWFRFAKQLNSTSENLVLVKCKSCKLLCYFAFSLHMLEVYLFLYAFSFVYRGIHFHKNITAQCFRKACSRISTVQQEWRELSHFLHSLEDWTQPAHCLYCLRHKQTDWLFSKKLMGKYDWKCFWYFDLLLANRVAMVKNI